MVHLLEWRGTCCLALMIWLLGKSLMFSYQSPCRCGRFFLIEVTYSYLRSLTKILWSLVLSGKSNILWETLLQDSLLEIDLILKSLIYSSFKLEQNYSLILFLWKKICFVLNAPLNVTFVFAEISFVIQVNEGSKAVMNFPAAISTYRDNESCLRCIQRVFTL